MSPEAVAIEVSASDAEAKAWDALSRYKFVMFGYWAAIWVHMNHVGKLKKPNPWRGLVALARAQRDS